MKKLWKIVAGLIVLGAAMLVTGCSHEPSYYYDVKYVQVSANDYNSIYRETAFDYKYEESLSWPGKSSYKEESNLSKAELIEFLVDNNCNRNSATEVVNSLKVDYMYFKFFSSNWDNSEPEHASKATQEVDCFLITVHK